jgi:alkane 1-monooxygenase
MNSIKYLGAYTIPATAVIGIFLGGWATFITPVYAFMFIPALELLMPQKISNLEGRDKERAQISPVFDYMLYCNFFIVYGLLFLVGKHLIENTTQYFEWIGITFSLGIVLGTNGINVGHELGHRQDTWERYLGKALMLPSFYMHFYIEHNFGHHKHAATPEDPATARYNQTVYHFWITSVSRQYINAWKIQQDLLNRNKRRFISVYNDMLWYLIFQFAYIALVYLAFGPEVTLLFTGSGIVGILLLESVNYIEHYGLIRKKLPSGRYERVLETHSWNSNHVVGRIVLYELTRHSDHHFKSSKKYQVLDYHETSPEMPYGYPTSLVLSLFPPVWFRIMNPRIPMDMVPA